MADSYSYKMKLFIAGCVFLAYFVHALVARQKGCSFSVHTQSEKNSPILLYNGTTLVVTNNGKLTLNYRDTITLACPDSKNYIIGTQLNVTEVQCVRGNILRLIDQDVTFRDLQCKRLIRGTVSGPTKKCGDRKGHIYKIGYPLSTKNFVTIIEVCYEAALARVFYTEHLLHGQDIKFASKSNYRPAFSAEGCDVPVSVAYKQAFQKAAFNKLLKSALLSREYINQNSFLERGHLSPDADFLFAASQYSSYYYMNVSPQWQSINRANWKKIEMLVRKFADKRQETLTIFTGTHGVLTLPDINRNHTEIYLVSGNKLPVPTFFWKIVYSKKTRHAIVFISINNPFVKEVKEKYILCADICSSVGWGSRSWTNHKHGFLYCCEYGQFTAAVETSPKLKVSGILRGLK